VEAAIEPAAVEEEPVAAKPKRRKAAAKIEETEPAGEPAAIEEVPS
jgi:hypothetical protein